MGHKTVRLPGINGKISIEIAPFVKKLYALEGIEDLKLGSFSNHRSSGRLRAEAHHYDEGERTLLIKVIAPTYTQGLSLRIDSPHRSSIEHFVANYDF